MKSFATTLIHSRLLQNSYLIFLEYFPDFVSSSLITNEGIR